MIYQTLIGGEAGYGIMTTGLLLSKLAARAGKRAFDYVEYPSLVRGGHNAYTVAISPDEVRSLKSTIDLLVCFNEDTFKLHQHQLAPGAAVMYDSEEFQVVGDYKKIAVPFRTILKEGNGSFMMKNTVLLGSLLGLLDGNPDWLYENIEKQFAKKGEKVVEFNKFFVKAGYEYVQKHYAEYITSILGKVEGPEKQMVLAGNDAFCLGAELADCRFYAAYPMTPSSTVLTTMASWQDKAQIIVRHAEDEIAVINTALGASFAGVRAAVGTSGGGFALMVEGVSLAGVTETPIVIFLSQRPGPATGMPTWTEQGDLLFAVHAGHGEFPKIVLAPGDVEEMVELTAKAFNLADIYQTPVIVMSDMLLSESHKSMSIPRFNEIAASYTVNRGALISHVDEQPYLRYKITESGISPRLTPGVKGAFWQNNSYEHEEDSHTTEHAKPRIDQVNKRARKMDTYFANHFVSPRAYGDIENAEHIIVCWGSTKGAVLEAIKLMHDKGNNSIACLHFTHMFPLEPKHIIPFFPFGKEYILIENNSHGQLGRLLRQECGIEIDKKFLKYDGRPIGPEEIVEFLSKQA